MRAEELHIQSASARVAFHSSGELVARFLRPLGLRSPGLAPPIFSL